MILSTKRSVHLWRRSMPVRLLVMVLGACLTAGCNGEPDEIEAASPAPIQIGAESVARATREEIRTGPLVSGQLVAERNATVRAEAGGSVVQTTLEAGQPVRKGTVLARIDARDLADNVTSSEVAVRSAENALELARSELRRTEALVAGGALAQRDLEGARNTVANAESQLAAAKARTSTAQAQLGNTVVRAPIGGVISAKTVNTGDVVTPGTALYTIIDPTSMRLEASVPSEQIGSVRVGLPVQFTVRGYQAQSFTGRVERISPSADPVTRQVPIWISIGKGNEGLIAGLYAEGRVETELRQAIVVPGNAIDATTGTPAVTRVRDGRAERVEVKTGIRDGDTERVEITAGLADGDMVLVGAARGVTPGTPVAVGR
ncbi:efflux RND transporter periplasmic adaptor subunit [soil metagenome]